MNIQSFDPSQDPHSHYVPGQPKIETLHWTVSFDFDAKRIDGLVRYSFDKEGMTTLDTRGLAIARVYDAGDEDIPFSFGEPSDLLGTALSFEVPSGRVVVIAYQVSSEAQGVQWMSPELAEGHPFVYAQGEAINARTYVPCQDTPSVKFTFTAEVTVPKALRGLIAAAEHVGRSEGAAVVHGGYPFAPTRER